MLTPEEFLRAYDHARYPDLPAALAALDAVECEEPVCAARFGQEWSLMLTLAARCLKRIGGVDFEMREREPAAVTLSPIQVPVVHSCGHAGTVRLCDPKPAILPVQIALCERHGREVLCRRCQLIRAGLAVDADRLYPLPSPDATP